MLWSFEVLAYVFLTLAVYNSMDTSPLYTSVNSMNHFTVQVWYIQVHGLAEDHQADWALQLAQDGCMGFLLLQVEHLVITYVATNSIQKRAVLQTQSIEKMLFSLIFPVAPNGFPAALLSHLYACGDLYVEPMWYTIIRTSSTDYS